MEKRGRGEGFEASALAHRGAAQGSQPRTPRDEKQVARRSAGTHVTVLGRGAKPDTPEQAEDEKDKRQPNGQEQTLR